LLNQPSYLERSPFKILASISLEGHLLLLSGWLAWTVDGYDYFSVSLTAKLLAKEFDKEVKAIVSEHRVPGSRHGGAVLTLRRVLDDSHHPDSFVSVSGSRDFR
jgi:hypothetical protein